MLNLYNLSDDRRLQAMVVLSATIGETIQELKQVPSGHLYAMLMSLMDLETFTGCIDMLKRQGKVTESNHLLMWVK